MSITLAPAKFVTNAVVKQGHTFSDPRSTGGPEGLLARMVGFKSQGALHAHRYNGQPDGTHLAPPFAGGKLESPHFVPRTAIYVVWSYQTPIAWVDADGTVTIPDVRYSVTTTQHQGKCRAWLGAAVPGTTTHTHHVEQGYRTA